MRRGGVWLVSLSAAAVLLAAWVSTATYVPVLRGAVDRVQSRPHVDLRKPDGSGSGSQSHHTQTPQGLAPVVTIFIYVVLTLFALALSAILWRRYEQRRRHRTAAPVTPQPAADEAFADIDAETARQLSRSAQRGLAALDHGTPRDAIVRCWIMLEEAVTQAGLARDPALTTEEFTRAVLARYDVRATGIADLGNLYREARFSSHQLGEPHRRRAVHALNLLRDDLDRHHLPAVPAVPAEPVIASPPGRS